MNSSIKLLDCTLRDGGYINNWDFGFQVICNVIRKMVEAEVDYVELDFLETVNIRRIKLFLII